MLVEAIWIIDSALLVCLIALFLLNRRSEREDIEELGDLGLLLPYIDLKLFTTLYALRLLEGGSIRERGRKSRRKEIIIRI